MEPSVPSIGGKEVGPVNMDLHDLSAVQIPQQTGTPKVLVRSRVLAAE
jgi:hypothetical protein